MLSHGHAPWNDGATTWYHKLCSDLLAMAQSSWQIGAFFRAMAHFYNTCANVNGILSWKMHETTRIVIVDRALLRLRRCVNAIFGGRANKGEKASWKTSLLQKEAVIYQNNRCPICSHINAVMWWISPLLHIKQTNAICSDLLHAEYSHSLKAAAFYCVSCWGYMMIERDFFSRCKFLII